MKVGIFICDSNGGNPVPAVRGGAVQTLVEHLATSNERNPLMEMHITSIYDRDAEQASLKYKNIKMHWVRIPSIIKKLDFITFVLVSHITKLKAISYKSIFSLLWYIYKANEAIQKENYDRVVLEHNIPLVWSLKRNTKKGFKFYYHLHNIPRTNAKCKHIFEKCSGFLCVSQFLANQIKSPNNPIGPVPNAKVNVFFNCIDTTIFKTYQKIELEEYRKQWGIKEEDKVITFTGRLSSEKGVDILLKALEYVKTSNIKVLIAGNVIHGSNIKDKYYFQLKELSEKYKNIVTYTGFISQTEIAKLYNVANIAVFPSMWDEPAGLTMIEAMACGTPIITTRSGGIPEYVGDCAVVIERTKEISREIAFYIDKLFANEDFYRDLSERGQKRVVSLFSMEGYNERFLKAIDK